jgi:6-phosphogluconolactonase
MALFLERCAAEAVAKRGRFTLALSGGRTPRPWFEYLAQPSWQSRLPWDKTYVFWADERQLPYSDPQSNFGAFQRAFLDRAAFGPAGVFPMSVQGPLTAAAQAYSCKLKDFFQNSPAPPVFDLIVLGLGPDGHTASLFPSSSGLEVEQDLVLAVDAPSDVSPKVPRLSLSLGVLNAARTVLFSIAGQGKQAVLGNVFQTYPTPVLPASMVRPDGDLFWVTAGFSGWYGPGLG